MGCISETQLIETEDTADTGDAVTPATCGGGK